jgi:hypothetical protein
MNFLKPAVISLCLLGASCMAARADDAMPLADGKISRTPAVGYVWSCIQKFDKFDGVRQEDWILGGQWFPSRKPVVQGNVSWPDAGMSVLMEDGVRVIRANSLPGFHGTGIFPISPTDPAYRYDPNPNVISAHPVVLMLPETPQIAMPSWCLPRGMIGISTDGVPIFNPLDNEGRDAVVHEIHDSCGGHPQQGGQYHYHGPGPCLRDDNAGHGQHSDMVGYALDGFGIYGLYGENGAEVVNEDLDACHGHTHKVMFDGKNVEMYHYHMTREYPYTLGCFKGVPGVETRRRIERELTDPPVPSPGKFYILRKAAEALEIDANRLGFAVGDPPDYARAARILGIPESRIREAFEKSWQNK